MSTLLRPWCAEQDHILRQSLQNFMYINSVQSFETPASFSFRENSDLSSLSPHNWEQNRSQDWCLPILNCMRYSNMVVGYVSLNTIKNVLIFEIRKCSVFHA